MDRLASYRTIRHGRRCVRTHLAGSQKGWVRDEHANDRAFSPSPNLLPQMGQPLHGYQAGRAASPPHFNNP